MPETTTPTKAIRTTLQEPNESMEQILESAVVVNWPHLIRGGRSGLIHVEYAFAPGGKLDSLQIWSSKRRGYWLLACTYEMSHSKSHDAGVHFDNGFESEDLAHILEIVMQHQNLYGLPQNLGRQGLLQIATPTEKETKNAAASINHTIERMNSNGK